MTVVDSSLLESICRIGSLLPLSGYDWTSLKKKAPTSDVAKLSLSDGWLLQMSFNLLCLVRTLSPAHGEDDAGDPTRWMLTVGNPWILPNFCTVIAAKLRLIGEGVGVG
ncbi:hypothetical protein ACLOJK_008112 [Asimina triloba]